VFDCSLRIDDGREAAMTMSQVWIDLAAVLAGASPLIFAALGETLNERAGVVNLSLDGTMLLAGMVGFAVGLNNDSVLLGFCAAALVGLLVALVLCVTSLSLGQSQTAVGFVLTLLCTDLSSFLGNPYVRVPGVAVPSMPVPLLQDIPIIGQLFFSHDLLIYASFLLIPAVWFFLFRTRAGLTLRALGERPTAAYARGVNVTALRYTYTLLGGALVGIAGAAYTLDLKQGWSYRHIAGNGWIALAIVIFGGWNPWRVALGCYLFGALQTMATRSQGMLPGVPTQIFQVAPFALMILILVLVNGGSNPAVARWIEALPGPLRRPLQRLLQRLAVTAPAALGQPFEKP
jgi:simple sugar transport system permease protein